METQCYKIKFNNYDSFKQKLHYYVTKYYVTKYWPLKYINENTNFFLHKYNDHVLKTR